MFVTYLRFPSTYFAFLTWGVAGFMSAPTIASFVVHFFLVPVLLALTLFLAHREQ